ncbi:MAG: vitamin B12 dependent-methionine synthase activation domain-containing protein [Bacteroidales bacterium]
MMVLIVAAILHFLRNQELKEPGVPNLCLSDYIAPEGSGINDHIGAFVVSASIDENKMKEFADDDYASIMIRILSDRIAEAAAEYVHYLVRTEYWGFAAGGNLSPEAMFRNEFTGIRPAPGYPACPDHTEKGPLFELLEATERAGVTLTENFAMVPVSLVLIYLHTGSVYFNLGKIGEDQLSDYARRKGINEG